MNTLTLLRLFKKATSKAVQKWDHRYLDLYNARSDWQETNRAFACREVALTLLEIITELETEETNKGSFSHENHDYDR